MRTRSDAAIDLNPHYLQEVLRILSLYTPDIEVRAFGSRVKWTAKAYSDLDLALMTEMPLSLEQEAQLREAFDESTLPFKVDFVDWAAASKTFQSMISADSVVICPARRQPSDEKWSVMPLEEALDALLDYRGKTPEKTSFGVPLITAKIVKNGRIEPATEFIARDKYTGWMTRGFPRVGDVLLTTEAPLGEVAQLHTDYVALAQRLVALRGKAGVMDNTYLRYLLQTDEIQEQLSARATGTTVLGIKQSELRKIAVRLPSIERQREVAAMLALLDDRITLLRETSATLGAIAQALFKSWFVNFDPVRAKMEGREPEGMDEATAALFSDSFEETELGEVPRGWNRLTMADISTVGIGKTPPRKEQHWFSEAPSDIRWVSIRDMGAEAVYAAYTSEFLTAEAVERFNVRRVPDNTVMMSFKMTIGRVAITDGEMTTNEAIAHFKLGHDAPVSTEYIYLHLKQFDFSTLSSTSSIADAVNSKTVREIPILVPSRAVSTAFTSKIWALFSALKNAEQQAKTLANLRDSLLPRLISGQFRLPEANEQVAEALA